MKRGDPVGSGNAAALRVGEVRRMLAETRAAAAAETADRHVRIATSLEELVQRVEMLADRMGSKGWSEDLHGVEQRLERIEASLAELTANAARFHPTLYGSRNINATLIDGLLVGVPAEELRLSLYHAFHGFQEPGVLAVFTDQMKEGSTVVDVGACIGAFTLHAARKVGPTGKVYAFEPAPRTFDVLVENLKFNGFYDTGIVEAWPVAISDRDGSAMMNIYDGDFGLNTLYPRAPAASREAEVDTRRLDGVLRDLKCIDVVKIDAEGAERAVIAGMPRLIAANPQLSVVMEFAPVHLVRANVEPSSFAHELLDAGFTLRLIDDITGDLAPIDVQTLVERHNSNLLLRRAPVTSK